MSQLLLTTASDEANTSVTLVGVSGLDMSPRMIGAWFKHNQNMETISEMVYELCTID